LNAFTPSLTLAAGNGNPGVFFAVVRLVFCLILFTSPSHAIGATFPMAVRWFATRSQAIGRLAGALYASNTIGAAAGAMGAGFLLLPAVGSFKTVLVGVSASALAAVVALGVRFQHRVDD